MDCSDQQLIATGLSDPLCSLCLSVCVCAARDKPIFANVCQCCRWPHVSCWTTPFACLSVLGAHLHLQSTLLLFATARFSHSCDRLLVILFKRVRNLLSICRLMAVGRRTPAWKCEFENPNTCGIFPLTRELSDKWHMANYCSGKLISRVADSHW